MLKRFLVLASIVVLTVFAGAFAVATSAFVLQQCGVLPPTTMCHPVLTYQAMRAFPVGSYVVDKDPKVSLEERNSVPSRYLSKVVGYQGGGYGEVTLCVRVMDISSDDGPDLVSCIIPQETVRRQLPNETLLVVLKAAQDRRMKVLYEKEMSEDLASY